ncbi:hypothetical protein TNCV_990441, partial [Trichonephila clavipes]
AWERVTLFGGVKRRIHQIPFVVNNRADVKTTVAILRDRRPPINRIIKLTLKELNSSYFPENWGKTKGGFLVLISKLSLGFITAPELDFLEELRMISILTSYDSRRSSIRCSSSSMATNSVSLTFGMV